MPTVSILRLDICQGALNALETIERYYRSFFFLCVAAVTATIACAAVQALLGSGQMPGELLNTFYVSCGGVFIASFTLIVTARASLGGVTVVRLAFIVLLASVLSNFLNSLEVVARSGAQNGAGLVGCLRILLIGLNVVFCVALLRLFEHMNSAMIEGGVVQELLVRRIRRRPVGQGREFGLLLSGLPERALLRTPRRMRTVIAVISYTALMAIIAMIPGVIIRLTGAPVRTPSTHEAMEIAAGAADPGAIEATTYGLATIADGHGVLLLLAMVLGCITGSWFLSWTCVRLMQWIELSLVLSIESVSAADPRRPVLFLRSFSDDQVFLPEPKSLLLDRMLGYFRRPSTLDYVLLEHASQIGPVVALGRPGEKSTPYGAARGYFEHSDWQDVASGLMYRASAIVMCIDDTPGVKWEVEQLGANSLLLKTLFLVNPKHSEADVARSAISQTLEWLGAGNSASRLIAQLDVDGVVGFFFEHDGNVNVGVSKRNDRVGHVAMLRWFLTSLAAADDPVKA